MKHFCALLPLLLVVGCGPRAGSLSVEGSSDSRISLPEARAGFKTKLARQESGGSPPAVPPASVFKLVQYDSAAGKLAAYLSPAPPDKKQHPAIIWITGGDCNSIDAVWKPAPPQNDQTASAFRKAGIVMMFPSLRGGNNNPGIKEGFFGEVDDVLAAADFLAKQSYVDPNRIYLGGHSTGGTLVFLAAESSDRFRAVFSFGPVDDVRGYDSEYVPFDTSNRREAELRAPIRWIHSVKSPLFVFEGTLQGNIDSLHRLSKASQNPLVHFHPVQGADHFSILTPVTRLAADKILKDYGPTTTIAFSDADLRQAVVGPR
jgi:dienelactone hydrolase